jgi:hypothetical protein
MAIPFNRAFGGSESGRGGSFLYDFFQRAGGFGRPSPPRSPTRISGRDPGDAPPGFLDDFKFPWERNDAESKRFAALLDERGQLKQETLDLFREMITGRRPSGRNIFGTDRPFLVDSDRFKLGTGGIRQAGAAQRQRLVAGARAGAGRRLGARSGAAATSAINQGFGASFGGQAAALARAESTNLATRLRGVSGIQGARNFTQAQIGQNQGFQLGRGNLELGRERLKLTKEQMDNELGLARKRLAQGRFGLNLQQQQVALQRYRAYLEGLQVQDQLNSGGFSFADLIGPALQIASFIPGPHQPFTAAGSAISSGVNPPQGSLFELDEIPEF